MPTKEEHVAALRRAVDAGDTAAANEIAAYLDANMPSAETLRQQDWETLSPTQKMLIGAGQSVEEVLTGGRDLLARTGLVKATDAARRKDLEQVQSIDDGWKTAGNIAGDVAMTTLPAVGAMTAPRTLAQVGVSRAYTALPRSTRAALGIAGEAVGVGALEGIKQEGNVPERMAAAAPAAATTAVLGGVGSRLAKLPPAAEELYEKGVALTLGQKHGGVLGALEEALSYIPGMAGGIRKAREEALRSWNQFIRTSDDLPKNWGDPQDNMKVMRKALDEMYDVSFRGDMVLARDLPNKWAGVIDTAKQVMPEDDASAVGRVLEKWTPIVTRGKTAGSAVKQLDKGLAKLGRQAYRQGNQLRGDAFFAARDALEQSMPKAAAENLAHTKGLYTKYAVLRDASSKATPNKRLPPGMVTPGDLMTSAVKGRPGAASEGRAPLQDVAEQGIEVLGAGMPSASGLQSIAASTTPAAIVGSGLIDPLVPLVGGAARVVGMNPVARRVLPGGLDESLARGARRASSIIATGQSQALLDELMRNIWESE